jgi:hypothetical protein
MKNTIFNLVYISALFLSVPAVASEQVSSTKPATEKAPNVGVALQNTEKRPDPVSSSDPNTITIKMCFKNSTCSGKPWRKLDQHNCKNAKGKSWKANENSTCVRHL